MFVSIVGDSISTYEGYVPEGYAVFYDENTASRHGLASVYDTWWAQVNQFLKAYLCVNNAYSGSRVTGAAFPAASCPERTTRLHTAQFLPDIILVYIGFNDFGNGVPVWGDDAACFANAYEAMLSSIKARYPRAWILCGTLMQGFIKDRPDWEFPRYFRGVYFDAYNTAIREACRRQGCVPVDLAAQNIRYETLDGTHPTKEGHRAIAQCWFSWLKRE